MIFETALRVLADHDTAEPLRHPTGNYGLRCHCGLELWSPDERVVYDMHRVHVGTEIVRAAK